MLPMRYRTLGMTQLQVSELSLGTLGQGVDEYGLYAPDEPRRVEKRDSVALLLRAFEGGVNFVDTSPDYGRAEAIIGEALSEWGEPVVVATKVSCAVPEGCTHRDHVRESIEASRRSLKVERLDVIQLASATAEDIAQDELLEALIEARDEGLVGHLGAAVHGSTDALAAMGHEAIDMVQVPFNLLDQRASADVFPAVMATESETTRKKVALIVRWALLKGVLTSRRGHLPANLSPLREAADRAERWAEKNGDDLTTGALRFCLAHQEICSVLVGVRTIEELEVALGAAESELLHRHRIDNADRLALDDETLIDPCGWAIP